MAISGSTRVYFILGDPVAQVRAPTVFNHLFQQHGIDAVLVPLKLPASDLASFMQHGLTAHNVGGVWATIPHKEALYGLVQHSDAVAQISGAVNAVRKREAGGLEGALFDGLGFVKGLDHMGIAVTGRRVLVLGAGGGGCAVAAALAQRSPAVLAIHNRSLPRAQSLVARLQPLVGPVACVAASNHAAGFDLIVNCTSAGLKPEDPLPCDPASADTGAAVVDIIMSREPTPLLRRAHERGLRAEPGFEMLVQQVPEYLRFFGYADLAATLQYDLSDVRRLLMPA